MTVYLPKNKALATGCDNVFEKITLLRVRLYRLEFARRQSSVRTPRWAHAVRHQSDPVRCF
jgi:hypothetical protein